MSVEEGRIKYDPDKVQDQARILDLRVNTGIPEVITREDFPDIPAERLALAQFFAADKQIQAFRGAFALTENEALRRQINAHVEKLVKKRDSYLAEALPPTPKDANTPFIRFLPSADEREVISMMINGGVEERLTVDNFPSFVVLSALEIIQFKMVAVKNKIEFFEKAFSNQKGLGFNPSLPQLTPIESGNFMQGLRKRYLDLAREYLNAYSQLAE